MFFRKFSCSIRTKNSITYSRAKISIIIFCKSSLSYQYRISIWVYPAFLNIIYKSWNSVCTMAFYTVSTRFSMYSGTNISFNLIHSGIYQSFFYCFHQNFKINLYAHTYFLSSVYRITYHLLIKS